jgi:hypothetical protein
MADIPNASSLQVNMLMEANWLQWCPTMTTVHLTHLRLIGQYVLCNARAGVQRHSGAVCGRQHMVASGAGGGGWRVAVTNHLVTCSSGPNTISLEPSPTYNHLPDHCPAMRTQCAPAQAPTDYTLHPLGHGALSMQLNVASVPALIWRRPRTLP